MSCRSTCLAKCCTSRLTNWVAALRRPEGLDWVQREVINDCGQIGRWDAAAQATPENDSDLLSDSEDEEDALLDDPLALAVVGAAPPTKKPVPGTTSGKRGDKPCLGLLQRLTLCPRHENACTERLDEAAVSTVLLKSALWRTLRGANTVSHHSCRAAASKHWA